MRAATDTTAMIDFVAIAFSLPNALLNLGPIMDTVLSLLISVGIIAFGVWIVAGTLAAGSPLAWTLMGLLTVIVGLISLYGSVREAKNTTF
jgi:hypothetical protein